jgi:hypothetical protein
MLKEACIDTYDNVACEIAFGYCAAEIETPFFGAGVNP